MIRLIKTSVHGWTNVFSGHPVLEAELEGLSSTELAEHGDVRACLEKLSETFEALAPGRVEENEDEEGAWGNFLGNLKAGRQMSLGDLIGGIAVGLQSLDDDRVPRVFGNRLIESLDSERLYVAYHFQKIGVTAISNTVRLINNMVAEPGKCVQQIAQLLEHFSNPASLGGLELLSRRMIEFAEDRDIPWRVMDSPAGMVFFGQGRKQIRYLNGVSDKDSAIAHGIALSRIETLRMLYHKQIRLVTSKKVDSVDKALQAATGIGYPVIINPLHRHAEFQDFCLLSNVEEVRKRASFLIGKGGHLLVQEAGSVSMVFYRLVVIGGRSILAFSLSQKNTHECVSISDIHPDNRRMAERAVSAMGLNSAEVIMAAEDVEQSWVDGEIVIFDVEAGLPNRKEWSEKQVGVVASASIDFLFPKGRDGRIPIAAVTGTNGKTTTCRMLDHILLTQGRCSGVATTEGVSGREGNQWSG